MGLGICFDVQCPVLVKGFGGPIAVEKCVSVISVEMQLR